MVYRKFILIGRSNYDKNILRNPYIATKHIKKTREAFRQGVKGAWKDFNMYFSDFGFDLSRIDKKITIYHAKGDKNAPIWMGRFYKNHLPNNNYYELPKDKGHNLLQNYALEILQGLPIEVSYT